MLGVVLCASRSLSQCLLRCEPANRESKRQRNSWFVPFDVTKSCGRLLQTLRFPGFLSPPAPTLALSLVLLVQTAGGLGYRKAEALMERWRARSVPVQEHFESLEPALALRFGLFFASELWALLSSPVRLSSARLFC